MNTKTIAVDWNDEQSIHEAETLKSKLESQGWRMIEETGGLFESRMIFARGN